MQRFSITLEEETFAVRNFCEFREFGSNSRKFILTKKNFFTSIRKISRIFNPYLAKRAKISLLIPDW